MQAEQRELRAGQVEAAVRIAPDPLRVLCVHQEVHAFLHPGLVLLGDHLGAGVAPLQKPGLVVVLDGERVARGGVLGVDRHEQHRHGVGRGQRHLAHGLEGLDDGRVVGLHPALQERQRDECRAAQRVVLPDVPVPVGLLVLQEVRDTGADGVVHPHAERHRVHVVVESLGVVVRAGPRRGSGENGGQEEADQHTHGGRR